MKSERYKIANEFTNGVAAGIMCEVMPLTVSEHFNAGYDVGYRLRREKNEALNQYLISIGKEPMGVVKLAGGEA